MTTETPASAPAESTPIAASTAAVLEGNFSALQEARTAERLGKPLDPVPAKAETPTPAVQTEQDTPVTSPTVTPEQRELSRKQQKANAATREAVERATADLRAENERLKAQVTPKAPATPAPTVPEYKRYLALPDAPKLDQFESLEEHAAAMSVFVGQKMREDWTRDEQSRQAAESAGRQEVTKITTYQSRITEAGGKPFLDALAPDVQQLRPVEAMQVEAMQTGKPPAIGPRHVLTSEILKSALAPRVLQRLSDHPEELARFDACKTSNEVLIEFGKLEARVDTPAPVRPKTVTSSTAPTHISGTRSAAPGDVKARAYATNDFRALREINQQERLAKRGA